MALPKKILVVSLPRTGTTTLCRELLDLNYRVAHTAYSQASCEAATVIADSPAYADFNELNQVWSPDLWLYLHRPLPRWLVSIRFLIEQLAAQPRNRLPPLFWRCWQRVFGEFNRAISDQQLEHIYFRHQDWVRQSAKINQQQLLCVTLTETNNDTNLSEVEKSWPVPINVILGNLLERDSSENIYPITSSYCLNRGRVTAWAGIKHANKVASQLRGSNGRQYYDYSLMDT
ncbi:sulfotransferase [Halioxenophilus aromaticivorans]|uniref:Sulfotransferase family protein n=1 Tax=Halioxenophilus aromaticivorans TaxID=1306992 RepID=A0AAV3U283_9ALTE